MYLRCALIVILGTSLCSCTHIYWSSISKERPAIGRTSLATKKGAALLPKDNDTRGKWPSDPFVVEYYRYGNLLLWADRAQAIKAIDCRTGKLADWSVSLKASTIPWDMAVDQRRRKLYVTISHLNEKMYSLQVVDLEVSEPTLTPVIRMRKTPLVTVDIAEGGEALYYTEFEIGGALASVRRYDLTNGQDELLLATKPHMKITQTCAVSPDSKMLYWTRNETGVSKDSVWAIRLDGTEDACEIVPRAGNYPWEVECHQERGEAPRIYWATIGGKIFSVCMDGSDRQLVACPQVHEQAAQSAGLEFVRRGFLPTGWR